MPAWFCRSHARTWVEGPIFIADCCCCCRYWLALSEIVHGHAVVGLVKPGAQPRSVQGRLRLIAISHFVTAARFAEFINRKVKICAPQHPTPSPVGSSLQPLATPSHDCDLRSAGYCRECREGSVELGWRLPSVPRNSPPSCSPAPGTSCWSCFCHSAAELEIAICTSKVCFDMHGH